MISPLFESGAKGDVGVEKASPARDRVMRMYFILLVVLLMCGMVSRCER